MEDRQIVKLFLQRAEGAIAAVAKKYGARLTALARNILRDHRDADEAVSDTYLALWNTIPPQEPDPLSAYSYRICRNTALNKHRANTAQMRDGSYDLSLEELAACIPDTPLEETLQALVDIVRQGKALYVGISRWPKEAAQVAYDYLAAHDVPCLIYQGCYNLINREPEEMGVLKQAKENGAGFIVFSPLAQGLLTDRYLNGIPADSRIAHGGHLKQEALTEKRLNQIRALNEIALRRGQTLAEMALSWILKDEYVTSVIIGSSSVGQLEKNLKALNSAPFSAEELQEITLHTI